MQSLYDREAVVPQQNFSLRLECSCLRIHAVWDLAAIALPGHSEHVAKDGAVLPSSGCSLVQLLKSRSQSDTRFFPLSRLPFRVA